MGNVFDAFLLSSVGKKLARIVFRTLQWLGRNHASLYFSSPQWRKNGPGTEFLLDKLQRRVLRSSFSAPHVIFPFPKAVQLLHLENTGNIF